MMRFAAFHFTIDGDAQVLDPRDHVFLTLGKRRPECTGRHKLGSLADDDRQLRVWAVKQNAP